MFDKGKFTLESARNGFELNQQLCTMKCHETYCFCSRNIGKTGKRYEFTCLMQIGGVYTKLQFMIKLGFDKEKTAAYD